MWELLEAAHLSKKPGAQFNAYDNLFSIRKQDDETLVNLWLWASASHGMYESFLWTSNAEKYLE